MIWIREKDKITSCVKLIFKSNGSKGDDTFLRILEQHAYARDDMIRNANKRIGSAQTKMHDSTTELGIISGQLRIIQECWPFRVLSFLGILTRTL